MSKVKFLKPKEGLEVFLPSKDRNIKAEGENIVVDAYIECRIRCGSLVEAKVAKPKSTKKNGDEE